MGKVSLILRQLRQQETLEKSGSRGPLLALSPQRTERASFPALGSGHRNAPVGTRFRNRKLFAVQLVVTSRVKKQEIIEPVRTPVGAPDNVMDVPATVSCDFLVTMRTTTLLAMPEGGEPGAARQ